MYLGIMNDVEKSMRNTAFRGPTTEGTEGMNPKIVGGLYDEINYAKECYYRAKACMPEDSILAQPHSALLRFLEQHLALRRATRELYSRGALAAQGGYGKGEVNAYLEAEREYKQAFSLFNKRVDECGQAMQKSAKYNRRLAAWIRLHTET